LQLFHGEQILAFFILEKRFVDSGQLLIFASRFLKLNGLVLGNIYLFVDKR